MFHFFLTLFLFAAAVSFDGLAAGISYGLRRIRLSPLAIFLINLTSAAAVALSMLLGGGVTFLLGSALASRLGGVILVGLGLRLFWQGLTRMDAGLVEVEPAPAPIPASDPASAQVSSPPSAPVSLPKTLVQLRVGPLDLIIRVVQEPVQADLDQSGTLSGAEALLLGVALALDALAAGLAAALAGYHPLWTPLGVGLIQAGFLAGGLYLGHRFRRLALPGQRRLFLFLPALVLIALGVARFL